MAEDKEQVMVAGEAKPQRMLYEKCPICSGEPSSRFPGSCICKTGYVPVGVSMSQLEHWAEVDHLRRECNITMSMLREGRCGPKEPASS